MWSIVFKRLPLVTCARRNTSSSSLSLPILDDTIKNLSKNFRKELEELQTKENDDLSIDRIQYLRNTLQVMQKREKLIQDMDETKKLSTGKTNRLIDVFHFSRVLLDSNDAEISQMAAEELTRLRKKLNSIDNEVLRWRLFVRRNFVALHISF